MLIKKCNKDDEIWQDRDMTNQSYPDLLFK